MQSRVFEEGLTEAIQNNDVAKVRAILSDNVRNNPDLSLVERQVCNLYLNILEGYTRSIDPIIAACKENTDELSKLSRLVKSKLHSFVAAHAVDQARSHLLIQLYEFINSKAYIDAAKEHRKRNRQDTCAAIRADWIVNHNVIETLAAMREYELLENSILEIPETHQVEGFENLLLTLEEITRTNLNETDTLALINFIRDHHFTRVVLPAISMNLNPEYVTRFIRVLSMATCQQFYTVDGLYIHTHELNICPFLLETNDPDGAILTAYFEMLEALMLFNKLTPHQLYNLLASQLEIGNKILAKFKSPACYVKFTELLRRLPRHQQIELGAKVYPTFTNYFVKEGLPEVLDQLELHERLKAYTFALQPGDPLNDLVEMRRDILKPYEGVGVHGQIEKGKKRAALEVRKLNLNAVANPVPSAPPEVPLDYFLCNAVQAGIAEEVYSLVKQGANVNGKSYGITSLVIAATHGRVDVVTALINCGADVCDSAFFTDSKNSALMAAAHNGHVEVVNLLVDRMIDQYTPAKLIELLSVDENFAHALLLSKNGETFLAMYRLIQYLQTQEGITSLMLEPLSPDPFNLVYHFEYKTIKESYVAWLRELPIDERIQECQRAVDPYTVIGSILWSRRNEDDTCGLEKGQLKLVQTILEESLLSKRDNLANKLGISPFDKSAITNPLAVCVRSGDHTQAKRLILDGANVNNLMQNNCKPEEAVPVLHGAIKSGDMEMVKLLLDHGADINALSCGKTALYYAIEQHHADIAVLLIERGANSQIPYHCTPDDLKRLAEEIRNEPTLVSAKEWDKIERIYKNLVTYADDSMGNNCITPRHLAHLLELNQVRDLLTTPFNKLLNAAKKNDCQKILNLSQEKDFNINACSQMNGESALTQAARDGQLESVVTLIGLGANVNYAPTLTNPQFYTNVTALHWAARTGKTEIATALINSKADINAVATCREKRKTPLVMAIDNNHPAMVALLCEMGADVNLCNALHRAAQLGNEEMVRTLLQHNADINLTDEQGTTAEKVAKTPAIANMIKNYRRLLILAALENDDAEQMLGLFKQYNLGIDYVVNELFGVTALHQAAAKGKLNCLKALISAGADLNGFPVTKGKEDQTTPLMIAAANGRFNAVRELLAAGAVVSLADEKQKTALYYAAVNGHTAIVSRLLAAGAHVELESLSVNSPFRAAVDNGHREIVNLCCQYIAGTAHPEPLPPPYEAAVNDPRCFSPVSIPVEQPPPAYETLLPIDDTPLQPVPVEENQAPPVANVAAEVHSSTASETPDEIRERESRTSNIYPWLCMYSVAQYGIFTPPVAQPAVEQAPAPGPENEMIEKPTAPHLQLTEKEMEDLLNEMEIPASVAGPVAALPHLQMTDREVQEALDNMEIPASVADPAVVATPAAKEPERTASGLTMFNQQQEAPAAAPPAPAPAKKKKKKKSAKQALQMTAQ